MLAFIPVLLNAQHVESDQASYPFELRKVNINSQKQKLNMVYMYEKATIPNGKTVLLLHGKNFSGIYWNQTMKALLKKGYNVVAPDQIGFGRSAKPSKYKFSLSVLAENTKQLLDSLQIKNVIVIGHSMGGMLAVKFALMYPYQTMQLILENPIGLEDPAKQVKPVTVNEAYKAEQEKTEAAVKQYMLENYFHNQWKPAYDTLLLQVMQVMNSKGYAWNAAQTTEMIFNQPVVYDLYKIKVPAVLIIGQADKTAIGKERADEKTKKEMGNYPQLGKKAAQLIPNAQLIELDDIGHIPHIEDFELFRIKLENVLK